MIKKILTGVLALVLIMSISEAAYAANITTDGGTASVPVTYTVDNSAFEIVIPAVIRPSDKDTSFKVEAGMVNIRPDEYIEVSISSGCDSLSKVVMKRQNVPEGKPVSTLETQFCAGGKPIGSNGYIVGHFEDGSSIYNSIGDISMSAVNVDDNTESGDYLATVEFKVDLKKK